MLVIWVKEHFLLPAPAPAGHGHNAPPNHPQCTTEPPTGSRGPSLSFTPLLMPVQHHHNNNKPPPLSLSGLLCQQLHQTLPQVSNLSSLHALLPVLL